MTDVGALGATEALVRRRLEGQQSKHMIDVGAHAPGAAGPPCPNARTDVIDDGYRGAALADALGDRVGELGAIDDDDGIGLETDRRIDRVVDAADDTRQTRQDRQRPHHRHLGEREDG